MADFAFGAGVLFLLALGGFLSYGGKELLETMFASNAGPTNKNVIWFKDGEEPSVIIEGGGRRTVRMKGYDKLHHIMYSLDLLTEPDLNGKRRPEPFYNFIWEGTNRNVWPTNPSEIRPSLLTWRAKPEEINPQNMATLERMIHVSKKYSVPDAVDAEFQERKYQNQVSQIVKLNHRDEVAQAMAAPVEQGKIVGSFMDSVTQHFKNIPSMAGPMAPSKPKP